MAGTSTDVNTLSLASACFSCLEPQQLLAIQTYLLTTISGGGSGGSTEVYALAGAATPVTVPTSGGIAYNAIGQVWVYSGGWVLIIS